MRHISLILAIALAACAPTLTFNQSFLVPDLARGGLGSLRR